MRNTPDNDLNTAVWIKSSYSQGGNECLEVARWRKSTYSDGSGGNCLEIADGHPAIVPVRDSKNPHGPKLVFRAQAWAAFVDDVKTR
ncbi:DUF397 domain-containing protein [Streptomyces sp. NBC_00201]|uniref:DUF397 domain-containing protein n=1 Tax=unclassified Streptomyces TaxID=2593676 RepID=UPI0022599571|nr:MULTISPECIES: DUF397 domain-containing protein [unclassified Streptomyces]MCX5246914.1 DUF397 domain-containing protein [Streptomyces sp. NBC_00201]MCX5287285.1 DUF397 domain-containing protein [Streptomyces sp. NBC_00183]